LKAGLRWILRAVVLIVLLMIAGTFIPRPLWPPASAANGAAAVRPILVLSNPIHTDIAIPLDDALRTRFAFLTEAGVPVGNPGARYLVVGWGGRSFYLETPHWADIKPLPVLRALTIDRSVMHVAVAGNIRQDDPAVTPLAVSGEGETRMLDFILASFALQDNKPAAIPGAHYGRYDAFYEANGFFNALVGCNTWTAGALREAGLHTGLWNPVPQTLAVSLKLYN
jgi:uncharacterized protein (TIGR02117 family)